jgi:hypothetical protein
MGILNDIFVFFKFSVHDHVSHLLAVLQKSLKAPVCPNETTLLLLDWFSWRFIMWKCLDYNIQFQLKSDKNNGHFTQRPRCVFREEPAVSRTPMARAHWGCHGNEVMPVPFIPFTDEVSDRASNVTLYLGVTGARCYTFCACVCVLLLCELYIYIYIYMGIRVIPMHNVSDTFP